MTDFGILMARLAQRLDDEGQPELADAIDETAQEAARTHPDVQAPNAAPTPAVPLIQRLTQIRPQLAAAAQEVYDGWEQDDDGLDFELGGGGICDRVSDAMASVISAAISEVEIVDGGADGDDHAWIVVHDGTSAYEVDIPHHLYESGGGYSWTKVPGVTFTPDSVQITAFPIDWLPAEDERESWASITGRPPIVRTAATIGDMVGPDVIEMLGGTPSTTDTPDPRSHPDERALDELRAEFGNRRVRCPSCGGEMFLRTGRHGPFWACSNYPKCQITQRADEFDLRPMKPRTEEQMAARSAAHLVFDKLWKGPHATMDRREAYRWMQRAMGMTPGQAHIGNLDVGQCAELISRVQEELGRSSRGSVSAFGRLASVLDRIGQADLADRVDLLIRTAQSIDPEEDPWSNEFWNKLDREQPLSRDRPRPTPPPDVGEIQCPDCGRPMVLRNSRYGLFYGCSGYPECRSTHGAHADGRPLGRPGTRAEKDARIAAHAAFDTLWNGPSASMSRGGAYRWMQRAMGLSEDDAHIGNFDVERSNALIELVRRYQDERASVDPETQKMRDTVAKLMKKLYAVPGAPLTREEVYSFMADKLGLTPEEAHVSQLTLLQCKRMVGHIATLRQSLRESGRIDRNVRLAMPPFGYHRTEPDRIDPITSEGFHGDIAPEYFEEYFDTFYADLSAEGKREVDEASIAAGYTPDEVEMGWSGDRWRNRWKRTVEALMRVWDDEHPADRLVWVGSDPLDDTFGDAALEVDLEGMPEFLNDGTYGAAHRYTLQPGEESIPASRFRRVMPEEVVGKPNPSQWWG